MTTPNATRAKLTTIAYFPEHFFLENLAVRADGSILITVLKHKQLWYVPAPQADLPVDPVAVHTFDALTMGIVEAGPDVFYVCTWGPATVERIDLRDWGPGAPVTATRVLTFDEPGAVLNGCCLIAPRIMLIADSLAGLIWRVDLSEDGLTATKRVWLQHESMAFLPDNPLNPGWAKPGVNGVRYAPRGNFVYYTSAHEGQITAEQKSPIAAGIARIHKPVHGCSGCVLPVRLSQQAGHCLRDRVVRQLYGDR